VGLVSVVVSSCDGFSDCWGPMFYGINKYWEDCPYPVYLITNSKDFQAERCNTLRVGEDRGWSANLLSVLERIDTPYVLYLQEDYWITRPVDTAAIASYVALMDGRGINYLRLMASPPPDSEYPHDRRLGALAPDSEYRNNLQAALWRKSVLRELIDPAESPWEFEIKGNERSRKYGDSFLCVKKRGRDPHRHGIYYTYTAVWKGRWACVAKRYARREGLDIDFSGRPSETWLDEFRRNGRWADTCANWMYRAGLLAHDPALAVKKIRFRLSGAPKGPFT
jgi:hypothetical protein